MIINKQLLESLSVQVADVTPTITNNIHTKFKVATKIYSYDSSMFNIIYRSGKGKILQKDSTV